jgi:hypothetical protein
LTWLRLIATLRKLNVGLKTVQAIKKQLFDEFSLEDLNQEINKEELFEKLKLLNPDVEPPIIDEEKIKITLREVKLSIFELCLYQIMGLQSLISIVISLELKNNEVEKPEDEIFMTVVNMDFLQEQSKIPNNFDSLYKNYISISLNTLLEDVLNKSSLKKITNLFLLNPEEVKLLEIIREKKYKSISVSFNQEGEPNMITTKEKLKINPAIRILDLISKNAHESFEVITHSGKVVYFERNRKIKLS